MRTGTFILQKNNYKKAWVSLNHRSIHYGCLRFNNSGYWNLLFPKSFNRDLWLFSDGQKDSQVGNWDVRHSGTASTFDMTGRWRSYRFQIGIVSYPNGKRLRSRLRLRCADIDDVWMLMGLRSQPQQVWLLFCLSRSRSPTWLFALVAFQARASQLSRQLTWKSPDIIASTILFPA